MKKLEEGRMKVWSPLHTLKESSRRAQGELKESSRRAQGELKESSRRAQGERERWKREHHI
jgi:hypothetical protein